MDFWLLSLLEKCINIKTNNISRPKLRKCETLIKVHCAVQPWSNVYIYIKHICIEHFSVSQSQSRTRLKHGWYQKSTLVAEQCCRSCPSGLSSPHQQFSDGRRRIFHGFRFRRPWILISVPDPRQRLSSLSSLRRCGIPVVVREVCEMTTASSRLARQAWCSPPLVVRSDLVCLDPGSPFWSHHHSA